MRKLLLLLAFCGAAFGQGVRFDLPPVLNSRGVPIANPSVSLCTGLATINGTTCSIQATSFTDITLATPCAGGSPVTLANSNVCRATGDALGNAGFWLTPGAYIYCVTAPSTTGQCYNLTVPVGVNSAGGIPTLTATTVTGTSGVTGTSSAIVAQANTATNMTWDVLNGGTDQKLWDFVANSTAFFGRAVNDAASSANNWLAVARGSGFTISNVQFPEPVRAQAIQGKLCVGASGCYANVAAAVTAAGVTNKTIIEIESAPDYTGTDCGAAQNNIIYIDYRGMTPPCNTESSLLFNPSTSAITQIGLENNLFTTSPTSGTAVTALQNSTSVTGTLPAAGGIVDGIGITANTTGVQTGTLGTLRGAEVAALVNGTGGAVSVAEGAAFYVNGSNISTDTIGTARGANFIGCNGQTFGVAPTTCSGADFQSQQAKGATNNFSARFFDVAQFNNGLTIANNLTTPTSGSGFEIGIGQVAATIQKSETGADASVLAFTQPAIIATYQVNITISVSAANAATIGWGVSWTDPNGNLNNQTNQPLTQSGTAAPALTFTTSAAGAYSGSLNVDTNPGANNITVKFTFSGTSVAAKVTVSIIRIA